MAAPNPRLAAITPDKLKMLDQFLTTWDPTEGWPSTAPLTVDERNALSEVLWNEMEITWLRVLGSVLNPAAKGHTAKYRW